MNSLAIKKEKLSVKAQVFAALIAIVSAVVLPQILHILGDAAGISSSLGEIFLPMHLPVIAVGLLAGPYAGAVAGILSPVISFSLTGMPSSILLPFMIIELCVYGLVSGMLRASKMPTFFKVAITQISGRALRAAAILISVLAFGNSEISISVIWSSILIGLIGIALQWIILPLMVYRVENAK